VDRLCSWFCVWPDVPGTVSAGLRWWRVLVPAAKQEDCTQASEVFRGPSAVFRHFWGPPLVISLPTMWSFPVLKLQIFSQQSLMLHNVIFYSADSSVSNDIIGIREENWTFQLLPGLALPAPGSFKAFCIQQ
jgi:hypothetical protein